MKRPSKLRAHAGKGLSNELFDYAFWLDKDYGTDHELQEWIRAFIDVDKRGDPARLIENLRGVVPPIVAPHLADLLQRKLQKPAKPGPKIPSYDRAPLEAIYELLMPRIRDRIKEGIPKEQAINEVAASFKVPAHTLAEYYTNKQYQKKRRGPVGTPRRDKTGRGGV